MIIPLERAKWHLRLDDGIEQDGDIELLINAAEDIVQAYLNRKVYPNIQSLNEANADGSAGRSPIVINGSIEAAVLLTLGDLYNTRENTLVGVSVSQNPNGVHSLLRPYRLPAGT